MKRWKQFVKYVSCDICGQLWPEDEIHKQYGRNRCPKCIEEKGYDD